MRVAQAPEETETLAAGSAASRVLAPVHERLASAASATQQERLEPEEIASATASEAGLPQAVAAETRAVPAGRSDLAAREAGRPG